MAEDCRRDIKRKETYLLKQSQITKYQLCIITISSVTVTGHLLIVPIVLNVAGRDGWLSLPLAIILGIVFAFILSKLYLSAPKQSLIEILCSTMGKALGKIVGLIYVGYFLIVSSITLGALMDFMTSEFMPDVPPIIFGLTFILLCAYAVSLGLETFLRAMEILFPFLIIAGITISVIVLPDKDFRYMLPILERGMGPVFRGCLPLIALIAEMVAIGMIHPALNQKVVLRKTYITSVLIIGVMFVGPLTGPIALFGAESAVLKIFPTFEEVKHIQLVFLGNLSPLAVFLWLTGSFSKISLFYYALSQAAAQIFELNNYKKLIIPGGFIILILAIFAFPDIRVIRYFLSSGYTIVSLSLGVVLPIVLLVVKSLKNGS